MQQIVTREAGLLLVQGPGIWERVGEAIGRVIGWLLGMVGALWDAIGGAVGDFFEGLARGVGLEDAGWLSYLVLGIGLLFVIFAVKGFLQRAVVGPLVLLGLGLACVAMVVS